MFDKARYNVSEIDAIRVDIVGDGWDPVLIQDPPGYEYLPHQHVTSKLLVFLDGIMEVEAAGQRFTSSPGDRLEIPGSTVHSARVGAAGCTYYWSEQVREREV